jgi:hypothetical protein
LLLKGGLQGARADLHSAATGFVDRDLYIFVIDRHGVYRLHGAKPANEGKRVHEVPGIDGDRFLRDAWAAVQAGGGWIDYAILSAETGKVLPKASYVVGVNDDLFVGCGVYKHMEQAAVDHTATASNAVHSARPATTPITASAPSKTDKPALSKPAAAACTSRFARAAVGFPYNRGVPCSARRLWLLRLRR